MRAHVSLAAEPPRRKATSPPSAHEKKPHFLAGQRKYCRPLLGVSRCTVAEEASVPQRHFGVAPGTGGADGGGGGSFSAAFSLPEMETCAAGKSPSENCSPARHRRSTSSCQLNFSSSGSALSIPMSKVWSSGAASRGRLHMLAAG